MRLADGRGSEAGAATALLTANARYWPTVLPTVHRNLRRWRMRASEIPNPHLRQLALEKIAEERFNTEVAATLATLAPRGQRQRATDAIVALQVMYDYLDGLSEEPASDPLAASRYLFGAFISSLTPEQTESIDYFRDHRLTGDGGYLEDLVAEARLAFGGLPGATAVAPVARGAALRCGESQTRTHAIPSLGTAQLAEWATPMAAKEELAWWEYTAGATASILSVHALIATAAEGSLAGAEVRRIDTAYLHIAAISTLLDSLIDRERDLAQGSHSFIAYYEDESSMIDGISSIVSRAAAEGGRIGHGGHHRMTAAGVAAYYLSASEATQPPADSVKARVVKELGPLMIAPLAIFRLWRMAKAVRRSA